MDPVAENGRRETEPKSEATFGSGIIQRCRIGWYLSLLVLLVVGCTSADSNSTQTLADDADQQVAVRFEDVTLDAGLGEFKHVTGAFGELWFPETMGSGGGFTDYDGDGWLDVVVVGGGTWPGRDDPPARAVWLYRNLGDGTFADVTETTGLAELAAYGLGVALADYDNDGDQDIFVSALGRNLLLRNDHGVFAEVARDAGLGDEEHWSTSSLFFDADVDGHADLYVGNYVEWSPEQDIWCTIDGETKAYCTPQLYTGVAGDFYHNNGDGTFSNWTTRAGFETSPGKTLGVAEWDFNQDGWPDLVVANDTQRDLLYINNGDGTFAEQGVISGIAFDENGRSRAGMGIDVGVVDDSGLPAVVVGHFANEMIGVYKQVGPNLFIDQAAPSQIGRPSLNTLTFGLVLADIDLDGDLDVFAANGHIDESAEGVQEGVSFRQHPQLFVNQGQGRFIDQGPPVDLRIVARAVAAGDYDRDGDQDLLITENADRVYLLRNQHQDAQSVRVRLVGRDSNRDGLGSYVIATVGNRNMHRRVRTGSGFLSSSDKALTFGLGTALAVDTLSVRWPDGGVEIFTDLPARYEYKIVEGLGVQFRTELKMRSQPET